MGRTESTLLISIAREKALFVLSTSLSYRNTLVGVQTAKDRFQLFVFFRFLPIGVERKLSRFGSRIVLLTSSGFPDCPPLSPDNKA